MLSKDQLFEAAKRLNDLLPERALRAAADYIGEELTGTDRADAVKCVELAGVIHARYESPRDESEAIPVVSGRGSSTAHFLKQEYLRAIEPAVRQVRSHYFAQETAPFPGDYDAAAEWLDSVHKDEEQLNKPTAEEAADIEFLRRRLRTQTKGANASRFRYMWAELAHLTTRRGAAWYEDAGGRGQSFGYGKVSPLYELAELTVAVSRATGFGEPDVVRYVLCGEEPRLLPVVAWPLTISGRVGDSRVDRVEVTLTVRSPDLSQADLQWIRTFVRQAWTLSDGDPPLRFEDEDEILRRLLIELGDDGGRRRRGFWPDLLARWNEEVKDGEATVPQLKMREQRLQKKLRQLKGETTP